jgi:predicted dithiol-disulfide oxidoreductase (DUF899 family)
VASQASIAEINTFKQKKKWTFSWVSSHGGDFNYDIHATLDEKVAPVEYNYPSKDELIAQG